MSIQGENVDEHDDLWRARAQTDRSERPGAWRGPACGAALALAMLLPALAHADCKIETLELPVTMVGTRAIATVGINGTKVPMMVDTGAEFSFLTDAAAAQLKLPIGMLPWGMRVQGATGEVETSMTTVDKLQLLGGDVPDVEFMVGGVEPGSGAMGVIGRNLLSFTDTEYDLARGVIRFVVPDAGCEKSNMAYWAGNTPVSEIDLLRQERRNRPAMRSVVTLNGKRLIALFDSGASSDVSLKAALGAGVARADMAPIGVIYGAGSQSAKTWTAPIAQVNVGGEIISNNRLLVSDFDMADQDMLLGIDFFLSHHIYVSNKRHRMFFTYNGGRVFAYNAAMPASAVASEAADGNAAEVLDAGGYARRGAASASRGDYASALADLDRACELDPTSAGLFAQRSAIEQALKQPAKAQADIDKVLELDPQQPDALVRRASTRATAGNSDGALADLAVLDRTLAPEAQLRLAMARLYQSLHAPAQALVQFNLWIPGHPHEFQLEFVLNSRCWTRMELGIELDKALADCDAAVDANPKSAGFLGGRGWVYLRQGKLQKAQADFDRSVAIRPLAATSL